MASVEQIQTWIAEVEEQRHAYLTGRQVKEVWRDGRRVTRAVPESVAEFDTALTQLRAELAEAMTLAGQPVARRRAIPLGWRN